MSERIMCPSCGAGLVLPESVRGSLATCPRCLAEISTITTSAAGREADAIQTERPERREERVSLREHRSDDAPDLDVRRDMKGTSCFVVGLAVIGVLGILVLGGQTYSWAAESNVTPLVYFVVALLFLAGLSTLIVFLRSRGNPGASGVRRVIVGTLALAGVGTLVLLLVIFSIIVYICIVCSQHTGSPL
jgi:hypothetical protein